MTHETTKVISPHAVDLNNLAALYEQARYEQYLEAGDFHSLPPAPKSQAPAVGYIAAGWMRPGADAMRSRPEVLPQ